MTERVGKMPPGVEREPEMPVAVDGSSASGVWLADSVAEAARSRNITAREEGSLRILLLVDDEDLGEWLLEELRVLRAAVAWSTKGREGLTLARSGLVDVVISEMGLPDLPGMDLLRELRGMTKMPKVILTTSRHSDFLAKRAIDDGASAVLSKPFQIEQLKALLINLLGN